MRSAAISAQLACGCSVSGPTRSNGKGRLHRVKPTRGSADMKLRGACLPLLLLCAAAAPPSAPAAAPAGAGRALRGTEAQDGLLPVHVDRNGGRVLLSLPAPDEEGISGRFIY